MERRIKLLLADDSPNIHKAVALGLRKLPYDLVYCDNGQDALRLVKEQLPDILLADLEMPGPSGAELCQLIKADPILKKTRVILLCGSFDNIDDQHLESLPADARIWKPFETQVLISVLQTVMKAPPPRGVEKTLLGSLEQELSEKTKSKVTSRISGDEATMPLPRANLGPSMPSTVSEGLSKTSQQKIQTQLMESAEPTIVSAGPRSEEMTSEMTRETFLPEHQDEVDFWGSGLKKETQSKITLPEPVQQKTQSQRTVPSPLPKATQEKTGSFVYYREAEETGFDLPLANLESKIAPKIRTSVEATAATMAAGSAMDAQSMRQMISEMVAQEVNLALRGHFKAEFQKILSDVLREIDSKTKLS